jgi:integrase
MPDGRFRARVRVPDGSRQQLYGRTPEEAARKLLDAQLALRSGGLVTTSRRPLADWLDQWLEDYVLPQSRAADSPRTYEAYEGAVRVRIKPLLGALRLDQLKAGHIQRAYSMLGERYAPKTLNFTHTVLAQALKQAYKLDLLVPNPMDKVVAPKRPDPNAEDKAVAERDLPIVERIVADLEQRHAPVWRVLVDTGLRWGEASALVWTDIRDLDGARPYLSIRRANTRVRGGLHDKAPKSKKGRRDVPLTATAVAALKVQRRRCRELELAAVSWTPNDLVFPNELGQPLRDNNVLRTFKVAQRAAGLERTYTLHQLRHTYATRHFRAGTHPKTVQDLLGHERIEYTLSIYTSSIPAATFEAVRGLPPLASAQDA